MNFIKKLYSRIFPASKYQVKKIEKEITREIAKEIDISQNKQKKVFNDLADKYDMLEQKTELMIEVLDKQSSTINKLNETVIHMENENVKLINMLSEKLSEKLSIQVGDIKTSLSNQNRKLDKINNVGRETLEYARENNYADVFNNTITNSNWLKQTDFSLGRWAIGYQCAYVLFRVLDEVKPQKILELGLGQSTKLISQYAENNPSAEHTVVESNQEWIDFFKRNYVIPDNTKILHCDWGFTDFEGANVRIFEKLQEKLAGEKYDLIMIDAPLGGDMKEFSRIDVLNMLPECLESSFVIMLDDVERPGEAKTFNEMKKKLECENIPYDAGFYYGKKIVGVLVSEDLKFVTTM